MGQLMKRPLSLSLVGVILLLYFFSFKLYLLGSLSSSISIITPIFLGLGSVNMPLVSFFILIRFLVRFLVRGTWVCSLAFLCNGVPTFIGVWLQQKMTFVPWFVVSGCLLFWLHPVGYAAAWYALLWLIPLIASKISSLWARMLVGSFCAHIVGSLFWLYGGLLVSPQQWIALIPIVIVERCLIALMASFVHLIARAFWQRSYTQNIDKKLRIHMG